MVNKLRLGAVALSTAAGIYVFNQSPPGGDTATAPAPGIEAPLLSDSGSNNGARSDNGPVGLPGVTLDRPPIGVAPPAPSPVRPVPDGIAPSPMRSMMTDLAGGEGSGGAVAEESASEIPSVADRVPGGKDVVRVYYGTNRKADTSLKPDADPGDYYTAQAGKLDLGIVEVSVPKAHKYGSLETRRWYLFEKDDAKKHFVLQRVVPTEESLFLRELNREIQSDPRREAFVFIHGFGTSFEAAAWRTGQLKADLEFPGPAVMYSWPSRGSVNPIAYFQDRDAVRDSRDELMQFLETIGTQTSANKIHVIAHSMGNYLLAPALAQLKDRSYLPSPMFDQLILAAPDISAELFLNEIAPKLDRSARRTTIYAADNDYALRVSQMVNRSKRLGTLLGIRKAPAFPFIEVVDTAGADFRMFEAGHSDYGGPVLNDLKRTIAGLSPTERGLARHHVVPDHWEVPNANPQSSSIRSNIVQVGHSEVIPRESITAAKARTNKSSLWSMLTSWWPW